MKNLLKTLFALLIMFCLINSVKAADNINLSISVSPAAGKNVSIGDKIKKTITVKNTTAKDVKLLTLIEYIPTNTEYVSSSPTAGDVTSLYIAFKNVTIAAGASKSFSYTVKVDSSKDNKVKWQQTEATWNYTEDPDSTSYRSNVIASFTHNIVSATTTKAATTTTTTTKNSTQVKTTTTTTTVAISETPIIDEKVATTTSQSVSEILPDQKESNDKVTIIIASIILLLVVITTIYLLIKKRKKQD